MSIEQEILRYEELFMRAYLKNDRVNMFEYEKQLGFLYKKIMNNWRNRNLLREIK